MYTSSIFWNLFWTAVVVSVLLLIGRFVYNLTLNPRIREEAGEDEVSPLTCFGEALAFVFTSRAGLLTIFTITTIFSAIQAFSPAYNNFYATFRTNPFYLPTAAQVAWKWDMIVSLIILIAVGWKYKPAH